jgi:6-phosphogluconolactonase
VGSSSGQVGAFRVLQDGRLDLLNKESSGGGGACHVWVNPSGSHVMVANYGTGNIAVFPLAGDGSVGEASAQVQFTGSGPNPHRQKKPHAHAIYTDADDRFVFVCDLGTDKIWSFGFDPEKGTLTPTEPAFAQVPPGGGPRHLALHPGGKFAYVNNEMGMSVTAFSRDPETGVLFPFQTISTLEEGAEVAGATAEIFVHPTGRWLYVSNRGPDTITVYEIADNGRLEKIQIAPSGVREPRGFAIDASGQWLVVAGQNDDRVVSLRIDQETGTLSASGHEVGVPKPVCILFR